MTQTITTHEAVSRKANDVKFGVHYGVEGTMCLSVLYVYPVDPTFEPADVIHQERLRTEARAGRLMYWSRR